MFIDKKVLAIVAMSICAVVLLVLNFAPLPARADTVIKDRDYQMITAKGANGGDALYVMDQRTGLMAIFFYDPNAGQLQARAFVPITKIFGQ